MANNNDILELFELVGSVTIDLAKSVKELNFIDKKANDVSNSMADKFKKMAETIKNIDISPEMDVDKASRELEQFKKEYRDVLKDLKETASVDIDTNAAIKDMNRLYGQAERLQKKIKEGNLTGKNSAVSQKERTMETAKKIEETIQMAGTGDTKSQVNGKSNTIGGRFLNALDRLADSIDSLKDKINVFDKKIGTLSKHLLAAEVMSDGLSPQTTPNGDASSNSPPAAIDDFKLSLGSKQRRIPTYDLDRSQAMMESYQRKMLSYAMKLNPAYILKRANQKLDFSNSVWDFFVNSKNMKQIQATFGIIESGITNARKQLSQLGFGRTKQEIKAIEGQMQTMANARLDNLRDQIKLTEKALKEMKKSANADQYVDDIKKMEDALKTYKDELENANPAQVIAKANGYKAGTAWGKNVIYKEYSNVLEKLGGKIVATANRDIAYALNKAYNSIDKSAIKIVGDQGTKALNKAKVGQLATAFQTLGMQIQMVAPIVGMLTAGIVALGKTADEAASQFEARTLMSDQKMGVQKRDIIDVSVATGADQQNVSETMSTLYNEMGLRGADLKQATEYGHQFAKVWGIDAVDAVDKVKKISKQLHVSEAQARNIMTLALTKYNGDIKQATRDVLAHGKAWEDTSKTNMGAYQKMTEGSMSAFDKLARATRQAGAALTEIWIAMEPLVKKIADKVYEISKAFTEWMREHPNAAKWVGYLAAITAGLTALSVVLLPLMGFLLMNRNLFQALAQGFGLMGKGIAVVNPQAKMMLDNMKMMKNGLLGMPRLMRSFVPGLFALFRGLPGMIASTVFQFIKLNPILSTVAALALLISKNFDKYKPTLESIWNSLKRIGKAFLDAFGGEGQSSAKQFNNILKKLSDVAAKVLVPALKALASILEVVANLMEGGGANVVATGLKFAFFATIIGKVVQSLSRLAKGFGTAKAGVFGLLASMAKFNAFKLKNKNVKATSRASLEASMSSVAGNIGNNDVVHAKGSVIVNGSPVYINGNVSGANVGTLDGRRAKNISKNARSKKIVIPNLDLSSSVKSIEKSGIFSKITNLFKKKGPGIIKVFGKVLLKAIPRAFAMLTGPIGTAVMIAFDILPILLKNKGKIVSAFTKFGKWSISGLKRGLSTISSIARTIVGWLNKYLVQPVKSFLGIASPSKLFAKFGRWIIQGLVNGIRNSLGRIKSVLNNIKNKFSNFGKQVYKIVSTYFQQIFKRISSAMSSIRKKVSSILATIRKSFSSVLHQILKTVSTIFQRIYNTIRSLINRVRNFISSSLSKIRRNFSSAFNSMYSKIKNTMSNIYAKIKGTFNSIGSFFGRLSRRAWGWGSNVAEGIADGITSRIKNAVDAIKKLGHKIASAFTKYMDIHSPSKLMYKIAQWIPKGVTNAIVDGTADVGKAAKGMGKKVEDDFDPNPSNPEFPNDNPKSGGFGSMSVSEIIGSVVSAAVPTRNYDPVAALAGMSSNTTNNNFNNRHTSVDTININVKKLQTDEEIDNVYRKVVGKMDKEVRRRKR